METILIPHDGGRHGVVQTGRNLVLSCMHCGLPTCDSYGATGAFTARCVHCQLDFRGPTASVTTARRYGHTIAVDNNADSIKRWIEAWTGLKGVEVVISE